MAEERVQRRLAAILAADVVGYSRMMSSDEQGTLSQLRALRSEVFDPCIEQFGGRIFKTTGDGAFAEFGSAVDAVQCSVEIQRALAQRDDDAPNARRMALRIGVSLGDVVVDDDDLYGNGVNIAARMESLAESGGICVSANVQEQIANTLNVAVKDLGDQRVKNIDRPIRCFRVILKPENVMPGSTSISNEPSIAVLPFDNLSGDPEQEYFSDGMADDLITDLSKLPNLFVAARNSSFSFKGQMPDVREVGEKLGVKFVLEGSVRKMGDRLRINAQLIGASDGGHVWAERYDGNMAEIFDLQDRIRDEILAALKIELTEPAGTRTEGGRTRNLEAYDHYLRGQQNYYRYTQDSFAEAFRCFERAIELDPDFADAYSFLAACYTRTFIFRWFDVDKGLVKALAAAEKAVSLDPKSPIAQTRLGWVYTFLRRYDEAAQCFETAGTLAPDLAEVYLYYGVSQNFAGIPERALQLTTKALELDPFARATDHHMGMEYLQLSRFDDAVEKLEAARARTPHQIGVRLHLASAYFELNRLEEAADQIRAVLELSPDYTVTVADEIFPYRLADVRRRFLDSLRKAGLPDISPEQEAGLAFSDKPSIAVLPFENMSGDPEQEYFSDGISEDIITALSRFQWFFVIARNSSFTYKGRAVDVKQVAQELGVQYVLEGSVRKGGDRVRITAQLIDASTGRHIWAERYDRDLQNMFAVQDEVTEAITSAVAPAFASAEEHRAKLKSPESLDAWACVMRGMALWQTYKREEALEAQRLFEQAMAIDPGFALAHVGYAVTFAHGVRIGFFGRDGYEKALQAARRAVALEDKDAWSHTALGVVHFSNHDHDAAIAEFEYAIQLNPNFVTAHYYLGRSLTSCGRSEAGIRHIEQAMRLSPRDPNIGHFHAGLARAYLTLKRFEDSVASSKQALRHQNLQWTAPATLASALAHLGRMEEAQRALREVERLRPGTTISFVRDRLPITDDDDMNLLLDGLRKAGMPEK